MQTKMLIGGRLVAGEAPALPVLDAATGRQIASVGEATVAQVNAAVAAAEQAFGAWAATSPKERAAALLRIAQHLESEADAYAALESDNTGKPLAAALNDEMPAIADVFRFFAGAAAAQHGAWRANICRDYTSMIRRDPVGVVASIAPWNYPLMMAAWKFAPALAAGNTVVLKPSEQTPLTVLKLAHSLSPSCSPRGSSTSSAAAAKASARRWCRITSGCAWSRSPAMSPPGRNCSRPPRAISSARTWNSGARLR